MLILGGNIVEKYVDLVQRIFGGLCIYSRGLD